MKVCLLYPESLALEICGFEKRSEENSSSSLFWFAALFSG